MLTSCLAGRKRAFMAASAIGLAAAFGARAQTAPAPSNLEDQDEPIVLSPFVVDATEDSGSYLANSTLAGTRIRTDLRDLSSAISVVTKQFLEDTGARDNSELLVYTTNTEVAGPRGNFSMQGGGQNYSEGGGRFSTSTRVRGLDAADNTRDYFLTDISWDSYNVDRIDLQRGPNSILFGLGSPAGIINASVNTAGFRNSNKVEVRFDEFGSVRGVLDINRVIVPGRLSVRVALLEERNKYQQKPAFEDDRRQFAAVSWNPQFFGEEHATSFRANFEHGEIDANYPRTIPPVDRITPWFNSLNKLTLDPAPAYAYFEAVNRNPWFPNEAFMGGQFSPTIVGYYSEPSSGSPNYAIPAMNHFGYTLNSAGEIARNGALDFGFFRPFAVAPFSQFARSGNSGVPGGAFWADYSLSDPSVFDFFNNLLDGPNKRNWEQWDAWNVALTQSLFGNRLNFEAVYDRQRHINGNNLFLGGANYSVQVDLNERRADRTANPDLGRPFVAGTAGGNRLMSDREVMRFTTVGELRADDVFEESWFTRVLGRHLLTGLFAEDTRFTDNRAWRQTAPEPAYAEEVLNIRPGVLDSNERNFDYVYYLGPDLRGRSGAAGAAISRVTVSRVAPETVSLRYFDSHWNAPNVDPGAPYVFADPLGELQASTQNNNRENYVGWTNRTFRLYDADRAGEIENLYNDAQKNRVSTISRSITWQGYLFDENLVGTFGWRRDEVKNVANSAVRDNLGVSSPHYDFVETEANTTRASGESKTWGVVAHLPQTWANRLPWGSGLSLFYNRGQNFKADAPRADVEGKRLPNPAGRTKDYGFVLRTLDDKLSLKVNWYETRVTDATLQAGTGAGFGSTAYYLWAVPAWSLTHAIMGYEYINGRNPNDSWMGNFAAQAAGVGAGDTDWQPGTPNFENSPATALQRAAYDDFFQNLPLGQEFFDAYGLGVSVAGLKSGDPRQGLVPAWTPGARTDIQTAGGGRILSVGAPPVTAVDTVSKGVEYELTAQPTKNWNVTLNASKTFASLSNVAGSIREYIDRYTEFLSGPAGDIRLWGTDPNNSFRNYWQREILAPYSVILSNEGRMVPELAEWRFNGVTNYRFDEGTLKGASIGGAVRWEGERILGYELNSDATTLDVTKPWKGGDTLHFDLFLGYSRKLTDEVDWRIQLNVRNVGESDSLVPVSKQPDGSTAFYRIQEGMSWQVTNTFTF